MYTHICMKYDEGSPRPVLCAPAPENTSRTGAAIVGGGWGNYGSWKT